MWSCQRCTLLNGPENVQCGACWLSSSTVTKMSDWWQCNHCCQFNAVTLMECAFCSRSQTALAVNAIGAQQAEQSRESAELQFTDLECRLVVVGKTGHGKSETANTILGLEEHFKCSLRFDSCTMKCQRFNTIRFGIRLEIVDTPGLFDTHMDQEAVITEVTKCLGIVSPGPHAVLLVVAIGRRFTKEENRAVEEVEKILGIHLYRFLIIIFTHGDDLEGVTDAEKEADIRNKLDKAPDSLKVLMKKANHRYVVFNNKGTAEVKQQQVKQLLTTVSRLFEDNGRRPFTSDLLQLVDRRMSEREKELEKQFEGKGYRHIASDRERHVFYREMGREELVHEKPLLDQLKEIAMPILTRILKALINLFIEKEGSPRRAS